MSAKNKTEPIKVSAPAIANGFTPRFRANAKQKASGEYYIDATVELYGEPAITLHDKEGKGDEGDTRLMTIGECLNYCLHDAEKWLTEQGRTIMNPPRGIVNPTPGEP